MIIRHIRILSVLSQPLVYSRELTEGKNSMSVMNVKNPSLESRYSGYIKELIQVRKFMNVMNVGQLFHGNHL